MDLLTTKIVAMILMGGLALFFGILPLKIKLLVMRGEENSRKRKRGEFILSGLLCFGSGVLLATVFIHMIPETREGFALVRSLQLSDSHEHGELSKHAHESHGHQPSSHSHDHSRSRASSTAPEGNNLNFHTTPHDDDHHDQFHHHSHNEEAEKGKIISDENEIFRFHHKNLHIRNEQNKSTPFSHHHDNETILSGSDGANLGDDDHSEGHVEERARGSSSELDDKFVSRKYSDKNETKHKFLHEHLETEHAQTKQNYSGGTEKALGEGIESLFENKDASAAQSPSRQAHDHEIHDEHEHHEHEISNKQSPKLNEHEAKHENNHTHGDGNITEEEKLVPDEQGPRFPNSSGKDTNTAGDPSSKETNPEENKNFDSNAISELALNMEENEIVNETWASSPRFKALVRHQNDTQNDSSQSQEEHEEEHDEHVYPMAELFICVGFFLIYILEEVVHKTVLLHSGDSRHGEGGGHSHIHGHPRAEEMAPAPENPQNGKTSSAPPPPRYSLASEGIDNPVFAGDIEADTLGQQKTRNSYTPQNQVSPLESGVQRNNFTASEGPTSESPTTKRVCSHLLENVRSLLIVIALSFHSVFEGMAVGLQELQEDVWYLFLAISAHKFVIAFCVGLELLVAKTPLALFFTYMLILALVTPFGIGIGIIVTENSNFGGSEHYMIITILQGIAGGTLLYVALLEVLERERAKQGGRLFKLFCLIVGFAIMASMEAIGGHSHGPQDHGH